MNPSKSNWFDYVNVIFFFILAVVMVIPFLNVLTLSLEPEYIASQTDSIHLFPKSFTLDAYIAIWQFGSVQKAFLNSVFVTVTGAVLAVTVSGMLAYGLAQRHVMGMRLLTYLLLLTMVLKTGIMPSYMMIKALGLIDSLWALVIPGMIAAFNVVLMKVFFENLPKELSESAWIDGYNDFQIFFRIIIPLSAPIIATVTLFYSVFYWNEYFQAVMYLTSTDKKTLQVLLREILIQSSGDASSSAMSLGKNLKMATAVYAILPILFVYPFLQRHFTKGIMVGAVKG